MLKTQSQNLGKITLLKARGSVDALTAPQLSDAIQVLLDERKFWLVADFADVSFVSSPGLRALLIGVKAARAQNGDIRVAAVQPGVLKVLQLAGFTNIIQTFDTVDAAKRSYN